MPLDDFQDYIPQPKPAFIPPILKLSVMPHDIAIYETASVLTSADLVRVASHALCLE